MFLILESFLPLLSFLLKFFFSHPSRPKVLHHSLGLNFLLSFA